MNERRKVERYALRLKTKITAEETAEKAKPNTMFSTDISSAGIFLQTEQPMVPGAKVRLEFYIPRQTAQNNDTNTMVRASGSVVRTDRRGMAVSFAERCRILPMD